MAWCAWQGTALQGPALLQCRDAALESGDSLGILQALIRLVQITIQGSVHLRDNEIHRPSLHCSPATHTRQTQSCSRRVVRAAARGNAEPHGAMWFSLGSEHTGGCKALGHERNAGMQRAEGVSAVNPHCGAGTPARPKAHSAQIRGSFHSALPVLQYVQYAGTGH